MTILQIFLLHCKGFSFFFDKNNSVFAFELDKERVRVLVTISFVNLLFCILRHGYVCSLTINRFDSVHFNY